MKRQFRRKIMDAAKYLVPIDIESEMKASYLDYSMSVIIGRALPDVRDGLKPVHRRILYAMLREGLLSNRRFSKCAGVVGEVLKKYHPHGDSAVYDALVRMAQPWNMSVPLVNGQGNFGSIDGDSAAAYRYTECKMTKIAEYLLKDIDKDTVNFGPNFDGSTEEPLVLPAAYPNLLVNGSEGIAVGMATKIPPHNFAEIINGVIAVIDNPEITIPDLMNIVPGPDFPTAGTIYGRSGILSAYTTGRGKLLIRGNVFYEESDTGKVSIIIDELPYQVNKARLIQNIANLVKDKRVEGISALRDESDRSGMRIVIELKRDSYPEIVVNHLYKHTPLQTTYGIIMLAIVNNRPVVLTLKEMMAHYISHRRDITIRRCQYELRKAKARLHVLEGYLIALDNIDELIRLIRSSKNSEEARPRLMNAFALSEIQAQAILDMRLHRLTGMEREKIEEERNKLQEFCAYLEEILGSESRLLEVIREELLEIRDAHDIKRRTRFVESAADINILDLIAEEEQVVTLTVRGYIKRTSPDEFQEQRRGGRGKRGVRRRNEDLGREIFIANTKTELLIFTATGSVYKIPVYSIPHTQRDTAGTPIVNLLNLDKEEKIASVLCLRDYEDLDLDLVFCSKRGLVKRTHLSEYKNIRRNGLRAYDCADGDTLLTVLISKPNQDILITTTEGLTIRFAGDQIRATGRISRGVKGINLRDNDEIASMIVLDDDDEQRMLTITERGYGKRTVLDAYRTQNRGGVGLIDIRTDERNGSVVGAVLVNDDDRVMMMTNLGQVIKIPVKNIRDQNRNTKGVRLMKIDDRSRIVSIAKVFDNEDEDEDLLSNEELSENEESTPDVSEE
jgi:DNA gyrase subunit A